MKRDGSDKRQVTKEDFRLLDQATWEPDAGSSPRRSTSPPVAASAPAKMSLYHVTGGEGVQLVKRASEQLQKELGEPIYSGDGR
ncbi:hypothetical protein AB5I41_11250 [Sphingomonas sp. MMS24-JH45]